MRSIGSPLAVSITMGMRDAVPGSARMRRQTSRPSMSGSIRSSTTRSGWASPLRGEQPRQAALTIGGMRDLETGLAQILRHHLGQSGVVLDHQQSFEKGR
jgi:hypothetical protein